MVQQLTGPQSWLARIAAVLALGLAVVAALALSAFFFGFFLVLAGIIAAWLGWQRWRLRHLIRKRRRANPAQDHGRPQIIQGEYEVVDDTASGVTVKQKSDQDASPNRTRDVERGPRH